MENIGRKNAYDPLLWQVTKKWMPSPTMETVDAMYRTLHTAIAESKLKHTRWTEDTNGKCQARGAAETYIIALAQFEWFFPVKERGQKEKREGSYDVFGE